jgi:small Trp-rich protein
MQGGAMPFVGLGLIFILLKWQEVGPIANWSWWWVLSPLILAFFYFEFFESMLGRDKQSKQHEYMDKIKQDRLKEAWGDRMPGSPKTGKK